MASTKTSKGAYLSTTTHCRVRFFAGLLAVSLAGLTMQAQQQSRVRPAKNISHALEGNRDGHAAQPAPEAGAALGCRQ